jgi:hypothetical protein
MTTLMMAAFDNHPAVISALTEAGADVDEQEVVSAMLNGPQFAVICCWSDAGRLDSAHVGGAQESHSRCIGTDCCES